MSHRPKSSAPLDLWRRRHKRPFRVRVLGAGTLFEEVCESVRVWGCELLYAETPIATRKTVDLLVLAGETRLIPANELARYRLGALCFHPSLLPRHRGRDAVYWTVQQGDNITGVTWFWLDEQGIDTGPIAARRMLLGVVPLSVTPRRLYYDHLIPLGAVLFEELLPRLLRGERPATPQDDAYATYEPPRPPRPQRVTDHEAYPHAQQEVTATTAG